MEAFTVMRTTGATEADLRLLEQKGFIQILNEDLVSYITHWHENNWIRADRRRPSVYAELLRSQSGLLDRCQTSDRQTAAQDRIAENRSEEENKAQGNSPLRGITYA